MTPSGGTLASSTDRSGQTILASFGSDSADRFDDILIACAPAQIGGENLQYFFVRNGGILLQRIDRQHQEAGRAEPALQRMMGDECGLHRVQLVLVGQTLDSANALAARLNRKHQT